MIAQNGEKVKREKARREMDGEILSGKGVKKKRKQKKHLDKRRDVWYNNIVKYWDVAKR